RSWAGRSGTRWKGSSEMARYSPTRTIQTTVGSPFEALSELIDRGREAVDRRRALGEAERQREVAEEDRAIELHERGIRRFGEQPTRIIEPERDVFQGARPGRAGGGGPDAPPIFQGAGIGMQPARTSGLKTGLEELAAAGRP